MAVFDTQDSLQGYMYSCFLPLPISCPFCGCSKCDRSSTVQQKTFDCGTQLKIDPSTEEKINPVVVCDPSNGSCDCKCYSF